MNLSKKFIQEGIKLDKDIERYLNTDYNMVYERLFKKKKERDNEDRERGKDPNKKVKRPSIGNDLVDLGRGALRLAGSVGRGLLDRLAGRKGKIKRILRDAKANNLPPSRVMQLRDELKNISNKELRIKSKEIINKHKGDKNNRKIAIQRKREMSRNKVNASYLPTYLPTYDEIVEEGLSAMVAKFGIWHTSFMKDIMGAPPLFSKDFFSKIFSDITPKIVSDIHKSWLDLCNKKKVLSYFISQIGDPELEKIAQSTLDSYNSKEKELTLIKNTNLPVKSKEKRLKELEKKIKDLETQFNSIGIPDHMKTT